MIRKKSEQEKIQYEEQIQQWKAIAHDIIDKEVIANQMVCGVFPLTFVEYYHDFLPSKRYHLMRKIHLILSPNQCMGLFMPQENSIIIFLDNFNEMRVLPFQLEELVLTCYHEVRHLMQGWFSVGSLSGYLKEIEEKIRASGARRDYNVNHDQYSFEIGANLYGIVNAQKYLKKNFPDVYARSREWLEKREIKYRFDYYCYDPISTIDYYVTVCRKKYQNDVIRPVPGIVSEIFLKKDFKFKKIREMMQHEDYPKLEKDLIYTVLSSQTFLKQVSLEKMDDEELALFNEALEYANTLYKNQSAMIEKYFMLLQNEEGQNYAQHRLKTNQYYGNLFDRFILDTNYFRGEKAKQKHQKVLKKATEKTKKAILTRENNGFFLFSLFYLIGGILSIMTLCYLFFRGA